jgi:hypothetical protein
MHVLCGPDHHSLERWTPQGALAALLVVRPVEH